VAETASARTPAISQSQEASLQKIYSMFAVAAALSFPVVASAAPQPPCESAVASPAFPPPGAAPAVATYHAADLAGWQPAPCTGWNAATADRSKLVVAVAGSFRFDGPIDRLLARIAAVSTLRNVQYWSTTDSEWRPLAYDASALSGPEAKSRRTDFTATELSSGASLYYWENDTRSGEVVMRLTVRARSADMAVVTTENVTPIRRFLVTLFPPGTLQTVLVIRRVSPKVWGAWLLSRTSDQSSMLAGGHEASYVNRAVALYRQIAAIPTNQEPPAMR
jgi:hypothetical protein